MNGIHPSLTAVAAAACAMICGTSGCAQSGGSTNPFLAPTRVPPPATRTIAPGTAQPYYPGDPLPVMQSAVPNAASSASGEMVKLASANEPTVAIPADGRSLRFELPPPPTAAPTVAAGIVPASPSTTATPPTAANTTPAWAGVVPAIYNAAAPTAAEDAASPQGPWRSPQIGVAAAPVGSLQPTAAAPVAASPAVVPGYAYVPPQSAAQPTMEVTLRAVPSPPPKPGESVTPRIRIPGYPPPAIALGAAPVAADGSAATDGFRPRTSMR